MTVAEMQTTKLEKTRFISCREGVHASLEKLIAAIDIVWETLEFASPNRDTYCKFKIDEAKDIFQGLHLTSGFRIRLKGKKDNSVFEISYSRQNGLIMRRAYGSDEEIEKYLVTIGI